MVFMSVSMKYSIHIRTASGSVPSEAVLIRLIRTTGLAGVRFVPRVSDLVLQQFPVHVEGLATLVTGELSVCSVSLLVLLQVADVTEP